MRVALYTSSTIYRLMRLSSVRCLHLPVSAVEKTYHGIILRESRYIHTWCVRRLPHRAYFCVRVYGHDILVYTRRRPKNTANKSGAGWSLNMIRRYYTIRTRVLYTSRSPPSLPVLLPEQHLQQQQQKLMQLPRAYLGSNAHQLPQQLRPLRVVHEVRTCARHLEHLPA